MSWWFWLTVVGVSAFIVGAVGGFVFGVFVVVTSKFEANYFGREGKDPLVTYRADGSRVVTYEG